MSPSGLAAVGDQTEGLPLELALQGEELQSTLMAMGYDRLEIHSALRAVAAQGLDPGADGERWLGDCLRWLSRSAA